MSEAYLQEKNVHGRYVHQLPPGVISPELRPVIEELGLEENCRQLSHEGYTIVENVAPPEFIARLREKILEVTPEHAFEFGAEGVTTDARIEVWAQLLGRNDGLYKRGDYSKAVEQLMNVRR